MDLRKAWADRQAAWSRYAAWEASHRAAFTPAEAVETVGTLVDRFAPPRRAAVLSEHALRASVRGPIELRCLLARARIRYDQP